MEIIFEDHFKDLSHWFAPEYPRHSAYLRAANVSCGGGLRIEANGVPYGGLSYQSGEISTRGIFEFVYGRVEFRARIVAGRGLWTGLWTLANKNAYEIDMVEILGHEPNRVYMCNHRGPETSECTQWLAPVGLDGDYHLYRADWEAGAIRWYVDDVQRAEIRENVSDRPHHLLISLYVGGWAGEPDKSTQFPAYLYVDHVRVWQEQAARWHGYVAVKNLNLTSHQWNTLFRAGWKIKGPVSDPQPARLCHWRTVSADETIYEAEFREDQVDVGMLRQLVATLLNVDVEAVKTATADESYSGEITPATVFTCAGVDYLAFYRFGGFGSAWMQSGDECRAYLCG